MSTRESTTLNTEIFRKIGKVRAERDSQLLSAEQQSKQGSNSKKTNTKQMQSNAGLQFSMSIDAKQSNAKQNSTRAMSTSPTSVVGTPPTTSTSSNVVNQPIRQALNMTKADAILTLDRPEPFPFPMFEPFKGVDQVPVSVWADSQPRLLTDSVNGIVSLYIDDQNCFLMKMTNPKARGADPLEQDAMIMLLLDVYTERLPSIRKHFVQYGDFGELLTRIDLNCKPKICDLSHYFITDPDDEVRAYLDSSECADQFMLIRKGCLASQNASESRIYKDTVCMKANDMFAASVLDPVPTKCLVSKAIRRPQCLFDLIREDTPMVGLGAKVVDLLAAIYELGGRHGFSHNDLHMGNILWDEDQDCLVAIDYGRSFVIPEVMVKEFGCIYEYDADASKDFYLASQRLKFYHAGRPQEQIFARNYTRVAAPVKELYDVGAVLDVGGVLLSLMLHEYKLGLTTLLNEVRVAIYGENDGDFPIVFRAVNGVLYIGTSKIASKTSSNHPLVDCLNKYAEYISLAIKTNAYGMFDPSSLMKRATYDVDEEVTYAMYDLFTSSRQVRFMYPSTCVACLMFHEYVLRRLMYEDNIGGAPSQNKHASKKSVKKTKKNKTNKTNKTKGGAVNMPNVRKMDESATYWNAVMKYKDVIREHHDKLDLEARAAPMSRPIIQNMQKQTQGVSVGAASASPSPSHSASNVQSAAKCASKIRKPTPKKKM